MHLKAHAFKTKADAGYGISMVNEHAEGVDLEIGSNVYFNEEL